MKLFFIEPLRFFGINAIVAHESKRNIAKVKRIRSAEEVTWFASWHRGNEGQGALPVWICVRSPLRHYYVIMTGLAIDIEIRVVL